MGETKESSRMRRTGPGMTAMAMMILGLLCGGGLANADERSAETDWREHTYYQFRASDLADPSGIGAARVVYLADSKALAEINLVFQATSEGTATFLIPSPSDIAMASCSGRSASDIELQVWVGDRLIGVLDAEQLDDYTHRLASRSPGSLRQAYEGWIGLMQELDRPGSARTPRQPRAPMTPASWKVLDACEDSCFIDYERCMDRCFELPDPDPACESQCENELDDCRASCPNGDVDNDGVLNSQDNCVWTYNPNQANCDGDTWGNVCDGFNATYQAITSDKTCWIDKDHHGLYFSLEHWVEHKERDVSSCGAPDRWVRWVRAQASFCFNVTNQQCCESGLSTSILQVGDNPSHWCNPGIINNNYCH